MPGTAHSVCTAIWGTSERESIAPCLHMNSCWLARGANELDCRWPSALFVNSTMLWHNLWAVGVRSLCVGHPKQSKTETNTQVPHWTICTNGISYFLCSTNECGSISISLCLRLWCPAMSNHSNHRSSTKSCLSQMGMPCSSFSERRRLQRTDWWWLRNLVESLPHTLLGSPWHDKWSLAVCVCE